LGFALNMGIARADPVQMADPEPTVVSSYNIPCDRDSGLCATAPQASSTPIRHRHRSLVHHASAKPRAAGTNQAPLIFVQQVVATNCNGPYAWSLLCPGTQMIGISY
jgi:hypothetical protein